MNGHSTGEMASSMNGRSSTEESLAAKMEGWRRSDADRDAFMAEILRAYEGLKDAYQRKDEDYQNEVEARRRWQQKAAATSAELAHLGSNSFVMVILDGDGALFTDTLYALGKDGGTEAAHRLHAEIKANLKAIYPDVPGVGDWTIITQIVLNLSGLAHKLRSVGIVANQEDVFNFARAFSLHQPMFSFIDVGPGKENADHKIRETLRVFLPNGQCKHVFFGPTHDNGYLVVLDRYRRDHASNLTLIETRPAEPGFHNLGLRMVSFPSVFRSDDLPAKQTSVTPQALPVRPARTATAPMQQMQPATASFVPAKPGSPAPSAESGASASWATVGKGSSDAKTINIATRKKSARSFAVLNAYDQRLDSDFRVDAGAEKRFYEKLNSGKKFCNSFHLQGRCEQDPYCDYSHTVALTPGEKLVLAHKARTLTCPKKGDCRDVDCINGHVCRYGSRCRTADCWFAETHDMDRTPAQHYYSDGTSEWLQSYLSSVRA